MRRVLRGVTVATLALSLTFTPAFADDDDAVKVRNDGRSGIVTVKAKAPGKKGASGKRALSGQRAPKMVSAKAPRARVEYEWVDARAPRKPIRYSDGSDGSPRPEVADFFKGISFGTQAIVTNPNAVGSGGAIPTYQTVNTPSMSRVPFEPVLPNSPRPKNAPPGAPAPAPVPQVDPEVLAQEVVSNMGLKAPEISSTPNTPDVLGAVGLPVWFWVANPGPTTTGPNKTTAAAGPVSVTAVANFKGLSIDTGDGNTITCSGPGTPYPGTGIEESPDCGHIYTEMSDDQPGEVYTVTTTARWEVTWTSNTGARGTIPVNLTTTKQIRIGSYQTVVTAQN